MKEFFSISGYLAVKEVWRNRGRFFLVSLVIALITLLVLFIAALGEGLGNGNREYISKLDAQLIVFQAKSDSLIAASRLGSDRLAAIRRVEGVADAGMLATANANIVLPENAGTLKVALLGIQPGHVGEPPVVQGRQLSTDLAKEVILDSNAAYRSKIKVGDTVTLRVTQGTKDEFYDLRVVGISTGSNILCNRPCSFLSSPGTASAEI
jgi:putative ABC transport system permease protein